MRLLPWFEERNLAASSYNGRIIEENSDDPKNFWKVVKKVLLNKSVKPQPLSSIDPITVDGKTTTDALSTANGFCTYFTNVVEKSLSSIPPLNWNQLSTEACLNKNRRKAIFNWAAKGLFFLKGGGGYTHSGYHKTLSATIACDRTSCETDPFERLS